MTDRLIKPQEAAKILSIGKTAFWGMVGRGELSAVRLSQRVVRFRESDIQQIVSCGISKQLVSDTSVSSEPGRIKKRRLTPRNQELPNV